MVWLVMAFCGLVSFTGLAQSQKDRESPPTKPAQFIVVYDDGRTATVPAADYKLVRWARQANTATTTTTATAKPIKKTKPYKPKQYTVGVMAGVGPTHILVEKGFQNEIIPQRELVLGISAGYGLNSFLRLDGAIFSNQTYTLGLSYVFDDLF